MTTSETTIEDKQGTANLVNTAKLVLREFEQTDKATNWRETEPEWWLAYGELARAASMILAKYDKESRA